MNVSLRDTLFLVVLAYLVIGAVVLDHVAKKGAKRKNQGAAPPIGVIVGINWAKDPDEDVHLGV